MIRSAKALLLIVSLGVLAFGQAPAETSPAPDSKSGAYYNFTMGRIYAELAQAYGNRPEYLNKAVQFYQEALKLDPKAGQIFEELTELFMATNRFRDAISTAEDTLKSNPDQVDARRMLGKVYMRLATQDNKINDEYLKKAIEQFRLVTEKDSKDVESWVMLGRLYRVSNNSPDAEKAFNKALAAEPENADALTSLAQLYSDLGDNARAIEKLKLAAEKSPNPETLIALGQTYQQVNDQKSAADAFKKAFEMNPDNARLARVLAQTMMQADRLDEALDLFQHLAAEEPRDMGLKLRIAEIYRAKRDFAKAREALSEVKKANPDDVEVRYNEVKLLEAEGKTPEAITVMAGLVKDTEKRNYSAAEAESRVMMLQELGILYRNNAQYPQALEQFRAAAKLAKSPGISLQIIDTYRAAKEPENARKEADAAIADVRTQAKGNTPQLHIVLATIQEKARRHAEQAAELDAAEKLNPTKEEQENIHFMRGAMLERQKKVDASESEFRKVLALNPENSGALNYLGYMLVDHGMHVDEATQMIKKALDSDPENGAYLDSLGWAYFHQGKYNEAETLLIRALERVGQDPTVHDHLADVYMKLGKTKEAITQWQASIKEFHTFAGVDSEPEDIAKVTRKLDAARLRLAKEAGK
jgi:tetratricopeptide (TPR) repeat protein